MSEVTVVNPGPQAPGLGLIHEERPKDYEFLARMAFPQLRQVRERKTILHTMFAPPIDQGQTGTCVGHGAKHKLLMTPRRIVEGRSAVDWYLDFIRRDQWADNDWGDLQSGTSLDAAGKGLLAAGYIESYHHIFDFEEFEDYTAGVDASGKHIGDPVLLGIPWPSNWFRTDDAGYLPKPSGRWSGGHCVVTGGNSVEDGHIPFPQSWGHRTWGARAKIRGRHVGPKIGWGKIPKEYLRDIFVNHWGHAVVLKGEKYPG